MRIGLAVFVVLALAACSPSSGSSELRSSAVPSASESAPSVSVSGTASASPAPSATATPAMRVAALLREAHAHLDEYGLKPMQVHIDGVFKELQVIKNGGSEGFPPQRHLNAFIADPGAASDAELLNCEVLWDPNLKPGDPVTVTGMGRRDAPTPDGKILDRFIVLPCTLQKR